LEGIQSFISGGSTLFVVSITSSICAPIFCFVGPRSAMHTAQSGGSKCIFVKSVQDSRWCFFNAFSASVHPFPFPLHQFPARPSRSLPRPCSPYAHQKSSGGESQFIGILSGTRVKFCNNVQVFFLFIQEEREKFGFVFCIYVSSALRPSFFFVFFFSGSECAHSQEKGERQESFHRVS
jgi:hypothetical protein